MSEGHVKTASSILSLLPSLVLVAGCATVPADSVLAPVAVPVEKSSNHYSVEPGPKTQVVTYHVQAEKFTAELEAEFNQALASLAGKCWVYSDAPNRDGLASVAPESCLKFVPFKSVDQLKPYMRKPTNKKMHLAALEGQSQIRAQNFIWDGAKLQRVANSDLRLGDGEAVESRFADFIVGWAAK